LSLSSFEGRAFYGFGFGFWGWGDLVIGKTGLHQGTKEFCDQTRNPTP